MNGEGGRLFTHSGPPLPSKTKTTTNPPVSHCRGRWGGENGGGRGRLLSAVASLIQRSCQESEIALYLGVFLLILSMKCQKIHKKRHHNFLKLKLTPLDVLCCPMKSPKPRQKNKNTHGKDVCTQENDDSDTLTHTNTHTVRIQTNPLTPQLPPLKSENPHHKIRFGWSEKSFIFSSRNKTPEVVGASPVKVRIKVAELGAEKESLEFRAAVQTTWVELIPEIKRSQVELIIGRQRKLIHIQQNCVQVQRKAVKEVKICVSGRLSNKRFDTRTGSTDPITIKQLNQ